SITLVHAGAFPWRDWISIHGLIGDTLVPLLGSSLFQNSNWGVSAGYPLLVVPFACIAIYFLGYRLMGRSWALLVLVGFLLFQQRYQIWMDRFAFWPLILILLWQVLQTRKVGYAL